jgi:hypothetical protein
MLRLLGVVVLLLPLSACESNVSATPVLGTYQITISAMGKSDPTILSIVTGSSGTLLLNFTAGITTDPGAPNAAGIRATLGEGNKLTVQRQPAHIEHSTGILNGTLWGEGQVMTSDITMSLHYAPTNFAIGTVDLDAGIVLSRDAGTASATLEYTVEGTKL